MKRTWMGSLFALGLLLIFLCTGAWAVSTKIGELLDDESGTAFELFEDEDGSLWVLVHHPDGSHSHFDIPSEGNPNPDDPNAVGGKPDIKELARRYYKGKLGKGVQTNNPLGLKRSGQGKGLAPIWNPPDTVKDAGGAGGGTGGTPKDAAWIKDQARRGKGGDDDDDNQGSGPKKERPGIGETGSVRPERVNPVPFLKTPQSESMAMEKWEPPVESGAPSTAGAPVETPTHTLSTTSGKAAGAASQPGGDAPPSVQGTPPGNTLHPAAGGPSVRPVAPKMAPVGGIQRGQQ